jgi:hypothetical protein
LINLNYLIFNLDDKNSTQIGLIDLNDKTPINYNETHLYNFFVIRKQLSGDSLVWIGEGMEQYIEVSFR